MPADEERIQILEFDLNRFKSETIKAYSDMAVEFAMVKGLTEDSVKRISAAQRTLNQHTEQLDRMERRLDEQARDIAQVEITLNKHTEILSDHTARLDRIETMLAQILARLPQPKEE
jgi:septal ring factor EnvC (AmiA/AmiB activator)